MNGHLLISAIVALTRGDVVWLTSGVVGMLGLGALGRFAIALAATERGRRSRFAQAEAGNATGGLATSAQAAGGR